MHDQQVNAFCVTLVNRYTRMTEENRSETEICASIKKRTELYSQSHSLDFHQLEKIIFTYDLLGIETKELKDLFK